MTYRRIAAEELADAIGALSLGFGAPAGAADWSARTDPEQVRVVDEDGQVASVLRLSLLPQYWLGRPVASAQVLALATSLEHRGRGHGLALLDGLFGELRDAGVPTVTLRPSTARFYRGAGFEFAGAWNLYQMDCERVPPLDRSYRARRLPADDLGPIIELYGRVAPGRHGAFARDQRSWRQMLARTRPHEDKEPVNLLVEGPDGPVGWAMLAFGVETDSRNDPTRLRVRVQDWGCLPGHDLAVPGALAGYRSMEAKLAWSGPDPDPLLFLLPNEAVELLHRPHWMLRLVDLAGAFGARSYPPDAQGRVVLRVEDPGCPWNSGTWALEVGESRGNVERVTRTAGIPEVSAGVRGLAALFTGFMGPDELVRVGLLETTDPAALRLLTSAFASPKPFTAELY